MKNTLKINITINSQIDFDIKNETIITKIIFSEFSNLFDYLELMDNLKTALKMNKNFEMLTIDFLINGKLENSYRVINKYNELKGCKLNFGKFDNFEIIDKKEINTQIKYIIENANRKFIDLIKN
jgi:hypothetical protein